MIRAIADTHALVWYLFDDKRLSHKAKQFINNATNDGEKIGFSAISLVEIIYLIEKEKIDPGTLEKLLNVTETHDAALVELPVTGETARKMREISQEAIPDMPDRIIAATALEQNVPIISRDGKIKASGLETIW